MKATLGGGCFWCTEASFQLIEGVTDVKPGYAGGQTDSPTYYDLQSTDTGHAEVVQLTFDEKVISYKDILDIFWTIHDPTTVDRQGNDIGPQYRSIILYHNETQDQEAIESIVEAQKLWKDLIVTEVKPFLVFYEAEPEHHDYFKKHPDQAYCQVVINPKLEKLQQKFASRLKKS